MNQLLHQFKSISRGRQIAIIGALVGVLSVFMPWHSIGVATLGTQLVFSGLQDQNLIVGVLALIGFVSVLTLLVMPLFGLRPPRLPWRTPALVAFFGGEIALLSFVLIFMHSSSLTRAANYDIGFGIQLCLVMGLAVMAGGLFARHERADPGHAAPLTRAPHAHHGTTPDPAAPTETSAEQREADRRMKMDL